jgi:hypothetical protein
MDTVKKLNGGVGSGEGQRRRSPNGGRCSGGGALLLVGSNGGGGSGVLLILLDGGGARRGILLLGSGARRWRERARWQLGFGGRRNWQEWPGKKGFDYFTK